MAVCAKYGNGAACGSTWLPGCAVTPGGDSGDGISSTDTTVSAAWLLSGAANTDADGFRASSIRVVAGGAALKDGVTGSRGGDPFATCRSGGREHGAAGRHQAEDIRDA